MPKGLGERPGASFFWFISDQREKQFGENLNTDLSELGINAALFNPTQRWKLSSLSWINISVNAARSL